MRIGIDARLWNETGVGRYIRNLVWGLHNIDKKNDYVLFVSKGFKRNDLGFESEKWRIVTTDIRWHTLKEQLQFPKIIEIESLDLVHFPYFSVPIYYNRPFVITIHDLIIHHFPTGKASTLPTPAYYLKLFGYKHVIKQAAQKAQKVIAVSQATKEEIVKHLGVPEDKVAVTYEGVDFRRKVGLVTSLPFPFNASSYFLYVGNAYPHKNLERLVDAFALVVKEFPETKLVLVGKMNYFYHRLKQKVKNMQLDGHIIFMGNVTDEALQTLYQHAEALIMPSLMEGFGLPGLEAMQSGCLVLASDIPSLKEVYRDGAIYFDPLAVTAMHVTIRKVLIEKNKFSSYRERGEKRVRDFSWKKMAEETVKIYESCLSVRSDQ